jgi:hypothetical protein
MQSIIDDTSISNDIHVHAGVTCINMIREEYLPSLTQMPSVWIYGRDIYIPPPCKNIRRTFKKLSDQVKIEQNDTATSV